MPSLHFLPPEAVQKSREKQAALTAAVAGLRAVQGGQAPLPPAPPTAMGMAGGADPLAMALPPAPVAMPAPAPVPMPAPAPMPAAAPVHQYAEGGKVYEEVDPALAPDAGPTAPDPSSLLPGVVSADQLVGAFLGGRQGGTMPPPDPALTQAAGQGITANLGQDTGESAPPAFLAWLEAGDAGGSEVADTLIALYRQDPSTAAHLYDVAEQIAASAPKELPDALLSVLGGGDQSAFSNSITKAAEPAAAKSTTA